MTAPDAPPSAVVKEMAHRMVDFSGQVHGLAADLSAQEALMAEMLKALRECTDDLEAFLDREYPQPDRIVYPDQRRRYDRDMAPVLNARALLAKIEGRNG